MPVAEPHKEIRFTRARQSIVFWVLAAVLLTAALMIFLVGLYRPEHPALPHSAWSLVPLAFAWPAAHVGYHCAKHAYLILTPLGIEIFPFFRPAKHMRLVYWSEIATAEVAEDVLTLHFNREQTSGLHLSLRPVPNSSRELLARAIAGRASSERPGTARLDTA